jgi:hypothetical protein
MVRFPPTMGKGVVRNRFRLDNHETRRVLETLRVFIRLDEFLAGLRFEQRGKLEELSIDH